MKRCNAIYQYNERMDFHWCLHTNFNQRTVQQTKENEKAKQRRNTIVKENRKIKWETANPRPSRQS